MRRTLTITVALTTLAALISAPGAAARAPQVSGALSPASSQRTGPLAPAAVAQPPLAGASQTGRRRSGRYLGGSTAGRFLQFVSLRLARSQKRASQGATLVVPCRGDAAIPSVLDNLTLTQITVDGGRAKGSGVVEESIPPGSPGIGGLSRRGTVTFSLRVGSDGRAAGTIRSRFTLTDPSSGEVRARCDTRRVRWSARIVPRSAGRGRPAPVGGTSLFGSTAQGLPFLLKVLRTGRAVRPAGMTFRAACPSLRGRPLDLAATVRMPIARGKPRVRGRFGASGGLVRRFSSEEFGPVTETFRWRLLGRFGANGAAGSWRVTGTVVRDSDGAEVATCTTGRNRWRAVR